MPLRPNEILIDDGTPSDVLFPAAFGRGAVPRDYATHPPEMFAPPSDIPLIPRSEWSDRIKEKEREKSQTSDILLSAGIPSLNQASDGFCWSYSTGGCVIASRALNNLPYLKLNPHAPASIIKGGRNEGGWCGLSLQFLREHGIPTEEFWPGQSRDLRHDTPAMRANAALHKVTEEWCDLDKAVYDQNLAEDMIASLLLSNVPVAGDFLWWAHSVMLCDLVEVEPGSFGWRFRNSWTDSYGDRGFGVIRGSKTRTMGAVALRTTRPSAA